VDNNDNNNNANNCPPDLTKLPNYKKKENSPPHPRSPARILRGQDALLLPENVAVALENCGARERARERKPAAMKLSSCVATHRITPPIAPGVFPVVRLKKKLLPYLYHQDVAILGWKSSVVSNSCKRSSGIGGAESAALFFCSRVKASLGGDSAFLSSSSSSSSRGRLCYGLWTCLGVDSGRLGSRINALGGGGGGGGGEGDGVVQARAARGILQPV
jgi:hypothetical protein